MTTAKRGWARPSNSKKFHLFEPDGRSLCGGWLFFGATEADKGDVGIDDCAKCLMARAKEGLEFSKSLHLKGSNKPKERKVSE